MSELEIIINSFTGSKALVYDHITGPLITKFYTASHLQTLNVTNFYKIGTNTNYGQTIIYVLSTYVLDLSNNIRLILDDFLANKYQSYVVVFVPDIPIEQKQELSRFRINLCTWNPFPLRLTPQLWVAPNFHLNLIVKNFGFPKKIIGKTNIDIKEQCRELKQQFLDTGKDHNDYTLVIFDRRRLQLPVLIQDFSYFGLLTDHCNMRYNSVKIDNITYKLDDRISNKYGLEAYFDLLTVINNQLVDLQKTEPVVPDKGTTDDLKRLIPAVDDHNKNKECVSLHLKLYDGFFDKLEKIHAVYELQYQIMKHIDVKPEIISMITDRYPVHNICSLVVLYNLYFGCDNHLLNLVGEQYGKHTVDCIITLTAKMDEDCTLSIKLYPYIMSLFDCTSDYMNYMCAWCITQIIQTNTITHLIPNEQYKINMLPPLPLHQNSSSSTEYGIGDIVSSLWNYTKSYIVDTEVRPVEENYIICIIGEITYGEIRQIQKLYPHAIIVCEMIVTCKEYISNLIDHEYYSQVR